MNKSTTIGLVVGWSACQAICNGLGTLQGIKAHGVTAGGVDTTYNYFIVTDKKLGAVKLDNARAFCQGLAYGRGDTFIVREQ